MSLQLIHLACDGSTKLYQAVVHLDEAVDANDADFSNASRSTCSSDRSLDGTVARQKIPTGEGWDLL